MQLDYIVYMTYDLHGKLSELNSEMVQIKNNADTNYSGSEGQWDYGNRWSQDGCPTGNCLRSQGEALFTVNYMI